MILIVRFLVEWDPDLYSSLCMGYTGIIYIKDWESLIVFDADDQLWNEMGIFYKK